MINQDKPVYIHYGSNEYSREKHSYTGSLNILSHYSGAKPSNGLWASRVDAKFGWKDWYKGDMNKYFKFTL